MTCKICDITNKKIASFSVYEDEDFYAFLDIRPLFFGHCLLSPKTHVPTFYDLPRHLSGPFAVITQRIGKAVEQGMDSQGSFIAMNNVVSQSIPHLHVHIVPRTKGDGLKGFFWPRYQYKDEDHMREVQQRIVEKMSFYPTNF